MGKQKKKLKRAKKRIAKLEKRVAKLRHALEHPDHGFEEKRVVDLIVGLTTEHVGRLLQQQFDERRLVDAVSRAVVGDVVRGTERALERSFSPRHVDALAEAIAERFVYEDEDEDEDE